MTGQTSPEIAIIDQSEVAGFLYREAMLLDRQLYDDWLDLFAEDGTYWVPAVPDQTDPINHVSLYYEDRTLMRMRIERLRHPRAFSLEQPSRSSRILGNIVIESEDRAAGEIVARCSLHMLEAIKEEQRLLGGFCTYRLRRVGDGLKIVQKRIDLINCESAFEALQVFI